METSEPTTRDRSDDTWRGVEVTRTALGRYEATNARGARLAFGSGDDDDFTPVELLLTALAGCGAVNVDLITSKRAEPSSFRVAAEGHKVREEGGTRLVDLRITVDVDWPDGPDGDRARQVLPAAVRRTHERLCTVSRTVELGTPVGYVVGPVER